MQQIQENELFTHMPTLDGADIPEQFQQQFMPPPSGGQQEVVISTALDPEMKVKKNYQRVEESKQATGGTQRCPKCQQEIPLAEWKEHMRLELMDPKWREERQKREERAKLNSLASGDEIAANLRKFAGERKDIFPQMASATEASVPQKVIWDGQAEIVTRTTANYAMQQQQNQRNL
jgi:splicing factor 3A subunit 1